MEKKIPNLSRRRVHDLLAGEVRFDRRWIDDTDVNKESAGTECFELLTDEVGFRALRIECGKDGDGACSSHGWSVVEAECGESPGRLADGLLDGQALG